MDSRRGFSGTCVVLALVVVSACLVGCGKAREPGRYYNDKEGFSIRLPQDWEQQEGFMGTTVMAMTPPDAADDAFRENINIMVEVIPSGTSLDDYCQASLLNMKKMMTDFEAGQESETTMDGVAARRLVYIFRMGEMNLKTVVYVTIRGQRAYLVTASASPETYEKYNPEFTAIVETWRFE